jgi:hypothetical protein
MILEQLIVLIFEKQKCYEVLLKLQKIIEKIIIDEKVSRRQKKRFQIN